ncbi:hypothetical protein CTAYLR_003329 [Chrysophaeum taylorii]|uniref:Phosphatase PP2A regulatory subunit A/Splicing factor 3B subunit 1-like HEAT repeat domain-containing protein n=1 Tax=Chrysophaeum taylorii TaxID=2483200 RepID=A0AAD7UHX2_9STRA|nr:hypothetical protein CTAYLR_003329 [Chrysophaeum taylorii]
MSSFSHSGEELAEVAVLIDQLKDEDAKVRVVATRNLCKIAKALGPIRTREELVPFVSESTDEGDEVLLAMVDELGKLPSFVGERYAYVLLEPIEALATVEEASVREKAVEAAASVAAAIDTEEVGRHLVPVVRRLATHDWFTGRMSACGLFAAALGRDLGRGPRRELRDLFGGLCRDDTPMVRRVAASALGGVVKADADLDRDRYLELFRSLADDDQDSVRLQTVENCVALASKFDERDVVPVVLATAADRSWRVRWSAAEAFPRICEACRAADSPALRASLCSVFVDLLNDVEAEVRVAAAVAVPRVAKTCGDDDLLMPSIEALATDASQQVRAALASAVGSLASAVGDARDRVLPVLLGLLRDANSEVRLNVISNLASVHDVVGPDVSKILVPAVADLSKDAKWRVRAAVIRHVPVVAARLGKLDDTLCTSCVAWLADDVAAVRALATTNLRALAKLFGPAWTKRVAVSRVVDMCRHRYYLRRVTALKACAALADVVPPDALRLMLLPAVLQATDDQVPNVRFNAAQTLYALALALARPNDDLPLRTHEDAMDTTDEPPAMLDIVGSRVIPRLDRLKAEDPDADVRDFAKRARDDIASF